MPDMVRRMDYVSKLVEITNKTHDHAADFRHIDCVYDHVKPHVFPEMLSRVNQMLAPVRTLLFYQIFKQDGALIYKMARQFSEELAKLKITVPARVIPADNKIVCIEFEDDFPNYTAVYIGCVDNPGKDSRGQVYKRLEFQFMKRPDGVHADNWDRYVLHFYSEDEEIEGAVDRLKEVNPDFHIPVETLKFALNCFLYVHSGDPDLRQHRPPKRPLTRKPKEQRRYDKMMESQHGVPVTLVGFDFKKERIFNAEGAEVPAHFQGYWTGKGRTDLKLRWKESYTKTFRKADEH
jgi:hypothetical protein